MRRLLLCLCVAACAENPFALSGPPTPLTPPDIYRQWYAELEACSGITGNYDAIRFYTMEKPFTVNGDRAGGAWHSEHSIYIEADLTTTKWLVKHEMMHDLLHSSAKGLLAVVESGGEHPAHYFQGVCGDLLWMNQTPGP